MTDRLAELRAMRDFLDREIAAEEKGRVEAVRDDPILRGVADLYSVGVDPILDGNRSHRITRARHAAAWLMRRRGMSLGEVALVLGVSKAQVCNAVQRVDGEPAMRALLLGLEVA